MATGSSNGYFQHGLPSSSVPRQLTGVYIQPTARCERSVLAHHTMFFSNSSSLPLRDALTLVILIFVILDLTKKRETLPLPPPPNVFVKGRGDSLFCSSMPPQILGFFEKILIDYQLGQHAALKMFDSRR